MALALCFLLAYIAEKFFGIADITGAYLAGIILCSVQDSDILPGKMGCKLLYAFRACIFCQYWLKNRDQRCYAAILLFTAAFIVVALFRKNYRLRPCGQALPFQRQGLPQSRRRHDDTGRGGPDRSAERVGCRPFKLRVFYICHSGGSWYPP